MRGGKTKRMNFRTWFRARNLIKQSKRDKYFALKLAVLQIQMAIKKSRHKPVFAPSGGIVSGPNIAIIGDRPGKEVIQQSDLIPHSVTEMGGNNISIAFTRRMQHKDN